MGEYGQYLDQAKLAGFIIFILVTAIYGIVIYTRSDSRNAKLFAVSIFLGSLFFFLGTFILPKPAELHLVLYVLATTTFIYALMLYLRLNKETGKR